jgi:hypothetical protein
VTRYTEGFSHFVTSMTAPVASGWSGRRVGLAPTEERRLTTAHTQSGHSQVSSHLSSRKQRLIYPDGSREKYCSVSIMLGKTAEVTHEVESVEVA